jgi:hypothetical protein
MMRCTLALAVAALTLAGCGGGDDSYNPTPTAKSLAFVIQPVGAEEGSPLATPPVVEVRDQNGDRLAGSTIAVTVALATNPSTATLGGTKTVNAVDGRATFAGLTVDKAGTGYTLVASASGLTSATSSAFDVSATPAVARSIAIVGGNNQSAPASTALAQPIKVKVTETAGGAAQVGVTVTFSVAAGGGTLGQSTVATDANGEAQTTWTLGAAGTQTVTATAPGVTTPASFGATILAGFVLSSVSPSQNASTGGGGGFVCGITADGRGFCWGSGGNALGNGSTATVTKPVQVAGSGTGSLVLRTISTGIDHACALNAAGAAFCWGGDFFGQLGIAGPTGFGQVPKSTPTAVLGGLVYSQLEVGETFSCGLIAAGQANAGKVFCWGGIFETTIGGTTPVELPGGFVFSSITAGQAHACGIIAVGQTNAGQARCWGRNSFGQLGDGTTNAASTPVLVSGGRTWSELWPGNNGTCGLTTGGQVFCWGLNQNGETGDGTQVTPRLTPVPAVGLPTMAHVATGGGTSCGIVAAGQSNAGRALCWGFNQQGQAGIGAATTGMVLTPTLVASTLTFSSIAVGGTGACGITPAGTVCWGANGGANIGDGTIAIPGDENDPNRLRASPTAVSQP